VVGGAVLIRRFGVSLYRFARRVCMATISSGVKPAEDSCVDQEGGKPMYLKVTGVSEKYNIKHKTYASSTWMLCYRRYFQLSAQHAKRCLT
jgi:hypothetical protein